MRNLSRRWWLGGLVVVVLAAAGLIVAQRAGLPDVKGTSTQGQMGEITTVNNANFSFLVPGKDESWGYDETSVVYEQERGVVKYLVKLKHAGVDITFSQQEMPEKLKDESKFNDFISEAKITRSQPAGPGKLYFVPALENSVPSTTGADTIIYATDGVLMFGKANGIVRYDVWAKLMASMKLTDPKEL